MKTVKSNKLACAAIVAALAIWAANAQAFPKLNFSLVAVQQDLDVSEKSSNFFVSTLKTSKITNKEILQFLATALNTNWPAGAQLVQGVDMLVVDKTGTNILFDVGRGVNIGDTNVVFFTMDSDHPVGKSKLEAEGDLIVFTNEFGPGVGIGTNGGSLKAGGNNLRKVFFHLFYEQDGITNTDFYFDGLDEIEYRSDRVTFAATTSGYRITGYDNASGKAPVTGDGTFNLEWTVIKGKVTSLSKQSGVIIPIPPQPPIFPPATNPPLEVVFSPLTNRQPPILLEP